MSIIIYLHVIRIVISNNYMFNFQVSSPIFSPQLHHLPNSANIRSRLTHLDLGLSAISQSGKLNFFLVCFSPIKCNFENLTLILVRFQVFFSWKLKFFSALEELFSVCSELQKLSLEHCTLNENICKNISKNQNLDTLNLTLCYNLSATALEPILENCQK